MFNWLYSLVEENCRGRGRKNKSYLFSLQPVPHVSYFWQKVILLRLCIGRDCRIWSNSVQRLVSQSHGLFTAFRYTRFQAVLTKTFIRRFSGHRSSKSRVTIYTGIKSSHSKNCQLHGSSPTPHSQHTLFLTSAFAPTWSRYGSEGRQPTQRTHSVLLTCHITQTSTQASKWA